MSERRRMIAVVDDDPRVLESLEELFESAGYTVRTFSSARALIDELGALGELDRYHRFHAAGADMLGPLGSFEAAAEAYRRALALMANGVERAYLERRLAAL